MQEVQTIDVICDACGKTITVDVTADTPEGRKERFDAAIVQNGFATVYSRFGKATNITTVCGVCGPKQGGFSHTTVVRQGGTR